MIRFVQPYLLLLLSLIPLVGLAWWWAASRAEARLADWVAPALQARLLPPRSRARTLAQIILALAALTLLTIAAARPQWGRRDETIFTRGSNLLIALDVSRSMLASDVHPNRLERAKVDILDLIPELKGDNAGLLAFRRRGILLCPLTTDYSFLRQAIDGVSPESAPRGETDLADAIKKSLEALEGMPEDHNAILLISDGEELTGDATAAAREAGKRKIPIFTVGIGDPAGATIPGDSSADSLRFKGQVVQTRLMESTLAAIARESGGSYIPLATAGTAHTTLGAIYRRHLRTISARENRETLENQYVERYLIFLLPAILALVAAACLSRGRLAGARTRMTPPPSIVRARALLAVLTLACAARAGEPPATTNSASPSAAATLPGGRATARHAQALYRRGQYEEAAAGFTAAARSADTDTAAEWLYNAALAWIQADKPNEAAALLKPLAHSRTVGPRAAELLASAALDQSRAIKAGEGADTRVAHLETAASALQTALRATPDDPRRIRNLSRVAPALPDARENAHIEAVLKAHPNPQPDSLLESLFREQRALLDEIPAVFTNEAPRLITAAEALAARQQKAGDLLIPLKRVLLESGAITNDQQRAILASTFETARDALRDSTRKLRDMDPSALQDVARIEPFAYVLWKQIAAPPPLVGEAITTQSNALNSAAQPLRYPPQPESLALTQHFRERFPEWADQVQQQAQADTNAPTLTPEARAEIERLAEETERLQTEALRTPTPRTLQQQALEKLMRIRELLPQNPSSGASGQPPPQSPPPSEPEPSESKEPPPETNEQKSPKPEDQKQPPPQDVQEMLRRALEREKEQDERKREQMRNLPMSPSDRDW
ncbi:MAG: VWA domain-containing protein [Lentisphaerae bacterium]|nr:VWA domain-containing protein [Lentisphaerota bacterium]